MKHILITTNRQLPLKTIMETIQQTVSRITFSSAIRIKQYTFLA